MKRLAGAGLMVVFAAAAAGQNAYLPQAQEYAVVGTLAGDQVNPAAALNTSGGYLVWEDNLTDGDGTAIVAQRLGPSLAGIYGSFRVNQVGTKEQQKPQVAMFPNGGAVVVWQGNQSGNWDVYASFIASNGTLVASDVRLNGVAESDQIAPAVACLANGNVVAVWGSFDQDGSFQGVYGRIFTPAGAAVTDEFKVNTSTNYNQRTPAVAALANGNFVVSWISEQNTTLDQVQAGVYAQLFAADAQPVGGEFAVSTTTNICANPTLAVFASGGFLVAWGQKGPTDKAADFYAAANSWDIFARSFSAGAKAIQRDAFKVNTFSYGEQYAPKAAPLGNDVLLVWSSLGQDGSREGVFGQFLNSNGDAVGGELAVNTTTQNQQLLPAAAADGQSRLLVVWAGFNGLATSFDLQAQRYEKQQTPLAAPSAPYVIALSQSRLSVTWPEVSGFAVAAYELYVDEATTPVTVTSNSHTVAGLAPGSTHSVKLAYRLADGRVSPVSTAVSGVTWGTDDNFDGLPDDWQASHWTANVAAWPAGNVDSDGDGVSNLQEFLAGTNPADAKSVLKTAMTSSPQGWRLNWNTVAGQIYQVQVATNLGSWAPLGAPRLAAANTDSVAVDGTLPGSFYRIIRIR